MSANSQNASWTGWRLVGVTGVVLAIGLLIVSWTVTNDIEAARAAIRYTARVSVTLFLLAFAASAAWQLWPSVFTRCQRQNRRYLEDELTVVIRARAMTTAFLVLMALAGIAVQLVFTMAEDR